MNVTCPTAARRTGWVALLVSALVAACGGGGADGPAGAPSSPAAGAASVEGAVAYTAGPVTGFGSVIVNGVRFDDSSARVVAEDGSAGSRDDLRLGMDVAIDSTAVVAGASRALQVRMSDALLGPVQAIDAAAGTVTVLGQTVAVDGDTLYGDGLNGFSALAVGQVIAVHGSWNSSAARIAATRIELKPNAPFYRLRGTVTNLDTAAKTFSLGSAVIRYDGLTLPPGAPALANGSTVAVVLQTTPVDGRWIAQSLRLRGEPLGDRAVAHLRGTVTAFTSSSAFSIDGTPVDASGAAFPDGTSGLALGARVEVHGALVNGTLVASRVELDERRGKAPRHGLELHGTIGSLDAAAKTFVLRGVKVGYGGTVAYSGGTEASLANGVKVEVKGTPGTDRSTLAATSIRFE